MLGTWRGIVAMAFACCALASCALPPASRPPAARAPNTPLTSALLINGGGTPTTNYLSHARHISAMRSALLLGGVDDQRIWILASDGTSPRPDLAVKHRPQSDESWLLEETTLDGTLLAPTRHHSSRLEGTAIAPATRDEVARWFGADDGRLIAGDTLVLFVTDHGSEGSGPGDERIQLWNRETVSVQQLANLAGRLDPRVRIVTVMSQCHSGGFAAMALDRRPSGRAVGSICGFFSTTADRKAYGCYPEQAAAEDDGHAFRFIAALGRSGSFADAHAETVVDDRTPDVPIRTSDVFLARVVEATARARKVEKDALVASLLDAAGADTSPDMQLARDLAKAFALALPGDAAAVAAQRARLVALRDRLRGYSSVWQAAVGDLAQANLDDFLATRPDWPPSLAPVALAKLPIPNLQQLERRFVTELETFTAARGSRRELLLAGRGRRNVSAATSFRSETRLAGMVRLETLMTSVAGRVLLDQQGTAADRAALDALLACEATTLPRRPPDPPARTVGSLPPIEHDERLGTKFAPAWHGVSVEEVPGAERGRLSLPDGAARVVAVDSGSPAQQAGVAVGDLLVAVEGVPVSDRGAMKLVLARAARGTAASVELRRSERRLSVALTAREPPEIASPPELPAAARTALRSLEPHRGAFAPTLAGGKPYLLFFWTTWCKFCKDAVPELLALERQLGLPVIAVTPEPADTVAPFLRAWTAPFPQNVALDPELRVNEALRIEGYPTFLHVDDRGRIRSRSAGYHPRRGLAVEGWRPPRAGRP